jgi:hypothetical protein
MRKKQNGYDSLYPISPGEMAKMYPPPFLPIPKQHRFRHPPRLIPSGMGVEPVAWQRRLLRLEEEDGAVAEVEVDEVLCLCVVVMSASVCSSAT